MNLVELSAAVVVVLQAVTRGGSRASLGQT